MAMKKIYSIALVSFVVVNFSSCKENEETEDYGLYNPNEYAVDLGLPSGTKWAKMNIGATNPQDCGDYFAWGETQPKEIYDWSTYKYMTPGESDEMHITKYQVEDYKTGIWNKYAFIGDGKNTLDVEDDAAAVNWGGDWRMPTKEDVQELLNCCFPSVSQEGDVRFYGNGNVMYLPKTGFIEFQEKSYISIGLTLYWTRTLLYSTEAAGFSYQQGFGSRNCGRPIRAVCHSNGNQNGHESVDLGLPSGNLWATCNIGANKPLGAGDYFAWGETMPKDNYDWSTYKFMDGDTASCYGISKYQLEDNCLRGCWYKTEYIGDNKTILEDVDDAAAVNWGGRWRMPSEEQIEELLKECYFEWTDDYNNTGIKGVIVFKAKSDADKRKISELKSDDYTLSDNHIFLPLTSDYDGQYFGKTLSSLDGQYFSTLGCSGIYFYISNGGSSIRVFSRGGERCQGEAIRPVWK